jgi:protein associated with RNAse G/E
MPAELAGDILSYIDLDIDVTVWPDGRVEVLDRDDFEENTVKFGYPQDVIDKAEAALVEVLQLIENGQLP